MNRSAFSLIGLVNLVETLAKARENRALEEWARNLDMQVRMCFFTESPSQGNRINLLDVTAGIILMNAPFRGPGIFERAGMKGLQELEAEHINRVVRDSAREANIPLLDTNANEIQLNGGGHFVRKFLTSL